ncbi:WbuC family cupin fold metalloprotein [Magnetococcus sp. PR-3]|uniref:WbuC family cupin fold metalloprotein n=1 Tax=Magnetococcus sp. PR-3 TaxID=3120355 RepID=UPI002FCE1CCF
MKVLDQHTLEDLFEQSSKRDRKRANLNWHPQLEDPIQRMFNALQPGTYVRPHRHDKDRWESFVHICGRTILLTFDDAGQVLQRTELSERENRAVEIPGGQWHTLLCLSANTMVMEVKAGPYLPTQDKDFAPWAPKEGEPQVSDCLAWMTHAKPGARFQII